MNEYFLGISWSTNQITIACLQKTNKNQLRLLKLDKLEMAQEDPQVVGQSIQEWVKTNLPEKVKPSVVLSVPESLIFIKELELPIAKNKELTEAIRWEMSSSKSNLPPDVVIQWKKIETKEKTVRLVAFAIKEEQAVYFSSVIESANLSLAAIEPTSVSFLRSAEINPSKTTLFINAEENETNLVIINRGIPVFSTTASVSLFPNKNERRKLNAEVKTYLSTEAKQVFSYWEEKESKSIQQIVIAGSGVRFSGLAKSVNQFAHVPTTLNKNKTNENLDFKSYSKVILGRYLIPLGAALRFSDETTQEINLLPDKERRTLVKEQQSFEFSKKVALFTKITFLILAVSLIFLGFLKITDSSLSKQIAQTRLFVNNHPCQKNLSKIIATNNLLDQIEKLQAGQKDTGLKLVNISQLTPSTLSFSSLKMNNLPNIEQWEIQGVGNRDEILAFYEKLKNSQATNVIMPYSNLNKETDNIFKISFIW